MDVVVIITLIGFIWIGWPLHSIASDLRALRKKAAA